MLEAAPGRVGVCAERSPPAGRPAMRTPLGGRGVACTSSSRRCPQPRSGPRVPPCSSDARGHLPSLLGKTRLPLERGKAQALCQPGSPAPCAGIGPVPGSALSKISISCFTFSFGLHACLNFCHAQFPHGTDYAFQSHVKSELHPPEIRPHTWELGPWLSQLT